MRLGNTRVSLAHLKLVTAEERDKANARSFSMFPTGVRMNRNELCGGSSCKICKSYTSYNLYWDWQFSWESIAMSTRVY